MIIYLHFLNKNCGHYNFFVFWLFVNNNNKINRLQHLSIMVMQDSLNSFFFFYALEDLFVYPLLQI